MSEKRTKKGLNPEQRDLEMSNLAVNLAEKQLRDGTASSQIITHYLKVASRQSDLELEKLRLENELLAAKKANLESLQEKDGNYETLIAVIKGYRGDD